MKISVVIVTRGDVDLGPCLAATDADEIVIRRGHGGVWERWEAAAHATHDVIFTQDDDCIVDFRAVVAGYEQGVVTCNMPEAWRPGYSDGIALVGFGAVFHRSALVAFDCYREKFEDDALFRREADRVFTGLNPCKLIDVPVQRLPVGFEPDRLWRQPEHQSALAEIRRRIYEVRE